MRQIHVDCSLSLLLHILEFEAGFIRLLDKLTNGSRIEVNESGNSNDI